MPSAVRLDKSILRGANSFLKRATLAGIPRFTHGAGKPFRRHFGPRMWCAGRGNVLDLILEIIRLSRCLLLLLALRTLARGIKR